MRARVTDRAAVWWLPFGRLRREYFGNNESRAQ